MRTDGNISIAELAIPGTGKTEAKRRFHKRILKAFKEYPDCEVRCLARVSYLHVPVFGKCLRANWLYICSSMP